MNVRAASRSVYVQVSYLLAAFDRSEHPRPLGVEQLEEAHSHIEIGRE